MDVPKVQQSFEYKYGNLKVQQFLLSYKFTALLALTLGLLLYLIGLFGKSDSTIIQANIEANLTKELSMQQDYINAVSSDFSLLSSGDFGKGHYPTFIFTKRKQAYWNTSKVDLKFEKLAELDTFGVTSIDQSKFLYQKEVVVSGNSKYILVSLIPLLTKYSITNQYLTTTLNGNIFPDQIRLVEKDVEGAVLIQFEQQVLFFIKIVESTIFHSNMVFTVNLLVIALIFFLIIAIYQFSWRLATRNKRLLGFVILIIANIGMRAGLIISDIPFKLTGMDLFNSSIYVSSVINPSLGDLLLNVLSLLAITLYLFGCRIYITEKVNKFSSKRLKIAVSIMLYFFSFWALFFYGKILLNILINSQISFDLSESIEFDSIRMVAFMVILIGGVIAFLNIHVIYKIGFSGDRGFVNSFLVTALPTILLMGVLGLLTQRYYLIVLLCHTSYFVIIYLNDFPSRMRTFKFGSLLYVLSAIVLLSGVGAASVYKGYERNELNQKQKFATKLLIDRDIEGEYLLEQISETVRSDMSLNSKLISHRVSVSQIKDRINQLLVDEYFSEYDVRINLFDRDGLGIGKNVGLVYYEDFKKRFSSKEFKTDFENIFFEGNFLSTGRKRYICFIELARYRNKTGYIILELHQKKQASKSVYPELLLDNSSFAKNDFDFAVYDHNELVHSVGNFNYKADFAPIWITSEDIFDRGIEKNGYHHLAIRTDTRSIVITSKVYEFWSAFSNFSLLNYETVKSFNFSTKILIYLGCAFAIPLLLVGAAILNTLSKSYKAEIDKSYQKQTIAMSENFVDLITDYYANDLNRDGLSNELVKISRSSRADISLYDQEGKLISTSQPKIMEAGLLSPYINPVAFHKLKNEDKDQIILEESLGRLFYKSSYVAIRSYQDGKLLGIMSSPFFSSKNHLERQETEVFGNIINISTLIFLISIGLSYVAVRRLTNPIMLIASKLKKTELSEDNLPLEWSSNDEIGVLVQEYNSMLEKLEVSKKELARSEKEAAWREMAKQVAHEIKNPLTPMKLTLQHLDRIMDQKNESRKSLSTLLSQVDTLDQIVTSFSHFAKMPDPENETINIVQELEKTINLHPDKNISFQYEDDETLISGDRKLFGRIFNNIVLNAFQSMSSVTNPVLKVSVEKKEQKALMTFRDIGTGISENIKEKVFVPNFSTKASGSGIGLAVAKRGIEHAGGRIWFEPNLPEGTVFYIELPLV